MAKDPWAEIDRDIDNLLHRRTIETVDGEQLLEVLYSESPWAEYWIAREARMIGNFDVMVQAGAIAYRKLKARGKENEHPTILDEVGWRVKVQMGDYRNGKGLDRDRLERRLAEIGQGNSKYKDLGGIKKGSKAYAKLARTLAFQNQGGTDALYMMIFVYTLLEAEREVHLLKAYFSLETPVPSE